MWCLWNGEYGEHNLSFIPTLDSTLRLQGEQYPKYLGCVVGDFTCENVEYDWGRRDQRWTVKCNLCGKVMYQYHVKDWKRGNGRKTTCDCRKELKLREIEATKKARSEKIEQNKKEHIGKVYGEWKVIEYNGFQCCEVECVVCGITKKSRIDDVLSGHIVPCSHRVHKDYSGDEWIGKRAGHLTVIGRDGGMFVARCDCGKDVLERPTILFSRKTRTTCGDPNCKFSSERQRESRKKSQSGHEYEQQIEDMLTAIGYNAKRTKCYADFGVDIIITEDDGTKVAVQCKKQDAPANVSAIQEVYAGGRFYDCTKFSVICDKGFSNPAIVMAKKLGVYLCDGEYSPPSNVGEYTANLVPVYHRNEKLEKLYEIDGERHTLADWCAIYGVSQTDVRSKLKDRVSIKTALTTKPKTKRKQYTVRGFTGTLKDVCDHYGILPQTVAYRMKQRGMSIEAAVFAPKGIQ